MQQIFMSSHMTSTRCSATVSCGTSPQNPDWTTGHNLSQNAFSDTVCALQLQMDDVLEQCDQDCAAGRVPSSAEDSSQQTACMCIVQMGV